jgi:HEAT repeat protein
MCSLFCSMRSEVCTSLGILISPRCFAFSRDDRWLVRHSAMQALKHTDSPAVEDHVLHLPGATSDPNDMTYCHARLNAIGSSKAIPQLEKNLKSRKADVKMSARFAIEAIKARTKD